MLACTHLSDNPRTPLPEIIYLTHWTPSSVTLTIAKTECTGKSVNQVIVVGIRKYLQTGISDSILAYVSTDLL